MTNEENAMVRRFVAATLRRLDEWPEEMAQMATQMLATALTDDAVSMLNERLMQLERVVADLKPERRK